MAIIGDAYIEVHPDTDKFGPEAESKIGGAIKKIAGIAAAAFAGVQVFDFVKGSIGAASDLNETISKSNTIFGAAGKSIEDWANTAAGAFGQSKQGALDAAGTFGNLFVQLGISSAKAADMSKAMVELASDFASFHNANPEEVIQAQTAAFRGEYDALQRFVPTINAAAVAQEAMAMTGKKNAKQLTDQEKALATQSLMMKGAGAAMGDFDRTSDGLANRQRILAARIEDVKGKLGNALLPVVSAVTGYLADNLIPAMESVGTTATEAFRTVQEWWDRTFTPERIAQGRAIFDKIMEAAKPVVDFVRDNLQPILIGLGVAVAVLAAPLAALAAGLVYAYVRFEAVRDVVGAVADFLTGTVAPAVTAFVEHVVGSFQDAVAFTQEYWGSIQEAVGHVMVAVREVIERVIAVISLAWRTWGDELLAIVRVVWDQIRNAVDTAVRIVRNTIQLVLALINGDWGKAWDAITDTVAAAWEYVRETVVNAMRIVAQVLEGALSGLRALWDKAWDAIEETVGEKIGAVLSFLRSLPGKVIALAAGAFDGIKTAAASALDGVVTYFTELPGRLISGLGNIGNAMFAQGERIVSGLRNGIGDAFKGLIGYWNDLVGKLPFGLGKKLQISSPSKVMYRLGQFTVEGLIEGIKSKTTKAQKAAEELAEKVRDAVNKTVSGVGDVFGGLGAISGRAQAQRNVQSAQLGVTRAEAERDALPGKIAAARAKLAAIQAADARVTVQETQAIWDAEDRVTELKAKQVDLAKQLAVAGLKPEDEARLKRDLGRTVLDLAAAVEAETLARQDATAASSEAKDAEEELKELLDSQSAVINAVTEAQDALNDARLDAVQAELAYVEAQRKLMEMGPGVLKFFTDLAKEAGLSNGAIGDLVRTIGQLRGGAPSDQLGSARIINPLTGRPAFSGPSGEGAFGAGDARIARTPGLVQGTMPDGTVVYYVPGKNIDPGNVAALAALQHFADGGAYTANRWSIVGDGGGPELFRRGVGGQVFDADDAREALGGGGRGAVFMEGAVQVGVMDTSLVLAQLNVKAAIGEALSTTTRLRPVP